MFSVYKQLKQGMDITIKTGVIIVNDVDITGGRI